MLSSSTNWVTGEDPEKPDMTSADDFGLDFGLHWSNLCAPGAHHHYFLFSTDCAKKTESNQTQTLVLLLFFIYKHQFNLRNLFVVSQFNTQTNNQILCS